MRGRIPGSGVNFDTQGREHDLPYSFDYYLQDYIQLPPMTCSDALRLGSLAKAIEPNTCIDLYGISAFSRSGPSGRKSKLLQQVSVFK